MKKVILALASVALLASCGEVKKAWTDVDRESVRSLVKEHGEKSALRHLEKEGLENLQECVISTIEESYPNYNDYANNPAQADTVVGVVVNCVGELLGPGYEALPTLFPLSKLQAAGVLPANTTLEQSTSFYVCLAGKLQNTYAFPQLFAQALLKDPAASTQLSVFMMECANAAIPATPTPKK